MDSNRTSSTKLVAMQERPEFILSKKDFGNHLKAQLDQGYEPKRIGSWAQKMYLLYCGKIDTELEEIMVDLFVLEEGREFEIPESQLRKLIKTLSQSTS